MVCYCKNDRLANQVKIVIIGCIAIVLALLFMSITSMIITRNAVVQKQHTRAIFMATDGIIDQPGGEKHLPYGKKRLMASIESGLHLEMKQQAEIIQQTFREYAADETLRDDITLLGFRL